MKKFTFLGVVVCFLAFVTNIWAADIYIDPGTPIWSAIASATPGDTIHLNPGTYNDRFVYITKSLTIKGEGNAVLDGQGAGAFCFQIQAPNVKIVNLEIENYTVGIQPLRSLNLGDLTVENCEIHNGDIGILLTNWDDIYGTVIIKNCNIYSNRVGISVQDRGKIDTLQILNTIVDTHSQWGMYLTNVNVGEIWIENSSFDHSGWEGIGFQTTKSTIGDFSIKGGSLSYNGEMGLCINQAASEFTSITLDGVTIKNNSGSGILVGGGTSTGSIDVKDCTFENNGWEDFDLSGGWFGSFSVAGTTTFTGNKFSGTAWAAIYIGEAGIFTGGVNINLNSFLGGGLKWGVFNTNALLVDATCNWWGTNYGPSSVGSDKVYGEVNYTPWSTISTFVSVDVGPDQTIYLGYGPQSVTLTATAISCGDVSYLWTPGGYTIQSIIVSPITTTTYTVTIEDDGGNTATDSVTVNVIDARCGEKNDKVSICHKGNTICISANAVPAHLNHGDSLGSCR